MHAHALRVLEYHRIREMIARRCVSNSGRETAGAIEPYRDAVRVRVSLKQTDEARALIDRSEPLPMSAFEDLKEAVDRVREANRTFEPAELLRIADTLKLARGLRGFLRQRAVDLVELTKLSEQFPENADIEKALDLAIESPGVVKDSASERLWDLRRTIRTIEDEIREKLGEVMNHPRVRDALQSPTISIRNGRFVVPVKIDMKGHVPGMLHDLSQTGATAFIEPAEIVPMTNRLREFRIEHTKEEHRILWELTRQVLAVHAALVRTSTLLAWYDVTHAKARLSKDLGMTSPAISADRRLRLAGARHPLLVAAQKEGEKTGVVPLDVRLAEGFRILVITGPNTGGKTVALKTVGLLQLMVQSGMHVTAEAGTVMPITSGVFADIGDEQSIDQSLSTFSGHIRNIAEITKHADAQSLVLLDELGAGTEPSEGAALGTAILDHLRAVGASCIVTTHLGMLKEYALSHPEVENACVEFDAEKMCPTYRLLVGQPGNSNALLIAQRYGLSEELIEAARRRLDVSKRDETELVDRLLESRRALEQTRQESEQQLLRSKNLAKAAEDRLRHLEKRERRVEGEADLLIDLTLKTLLAAVEGPLRELQNVPKPLRPAVEEIEKAVKTALRDSTLGKKRRSYIDGLKKDDVIFVPRLGEKVKVRKFDRDNEKLTVVFGKMTVEIDYDDVSWSDFAAPTGGIRPN